MYTYDMIMCARKILTKFLKQDMPGSLAIKIAAFMQETAVFSNQFIEEELRLAMEFAEKTADGQLKIVTPDQNVDTCIIVPNDKKELFETAMNSFLEQELHYRFDPDNFFTEDELAQLTCTPEEIFLLTPFIKN